MKDRLLKRIDRLHKQMTKNQFEAIFIIDKVNQYYFTGTMQDGVFLLLANGDYAYFVRRSFERAKKESPLDNIYSMTSYRDIAAKVGHISTLHMEKEAITAAMHDRILKCFPGAQSASVDSIISQLRSVKEPYELEIIEQSGIQHKKLLEEILPSLLREGMSEAQLTALMYREMIELGYHGASRFSMFQTEVVVGQMGFGDNSIYPAYFNGPGGMKGMSAVAPIVGSRERFLKKGDLVFCDVGYGYNGYHTDRTQIYIFGAKPHQDIIDIHRKCMEIQKTLANSLKPGAIPEDIYTQVINGLDNQFLENFMGVGNETVKFLGHGVGLYIDEYPVIAKGFKQPLKENMVIALEPKKSLPGIGIVGVEDTYIVTPNGGKCVTGGEKDIIQV